MFNKDGIRTDDLFAPVSFGGGGGGGGGGGSNRIRAVGTVTKQLNQIAENHPTYSDPEIYDLAQNLEANSAGDPNGDSYTGYVGGDWDGR